MVSDLNRSREREREKGFYEVLEVQLNPRREKKKRGLIFICVGLEGLRLKERDQTSEQHRKKPPIFVVVC